jgi:hypothetical protein
MAEVIDKDLGWKTIKKKCRFIDGKQVKAGVLSSAGSGKNGVSIAFYASCNEYGTYGNSEWQNIPARPFMATTAYEKKMWKSAVKNCVIRIMDGAEVISELNDIGKTMKRDIKGNVGTNKFKPLAPSTIARKGHSIQLMDSGDLYDAIDYEVK